MGVDAARHVVVVGGGIAGLAAAYTLDRLARQASFPLRLSVLEASERWGGKIRTERRDGFVIEAGPDTFVSTKPWAVSLAGELGLAGRLIGASTAQRKVYVLHRGALKEVPEGLAMMVPTRVGPILRTSLLSPAAKARLALERILPLMPGAGDETLGTFLSRRLGRQAYERLIEPLMSGIYAGDGDRLSLRSTFPSLRDWELRYGSVARGALAAARARQAASGPTLPLFLTFVTGLEEIISALVQRLSPHDLRSRARVTGVEGGAGQYTVALHTGEELSAQAVIVAAPAFEAARMLHNLDPVLATILEQIEYVTTATVSLAYRAQDLARPLDGHGYVVPRAEGRQVLACTWTSTKFPHRAPDGCALIRMFLGRAGQSGLAEADEEALEDIARQEAAEVLGIRARPVLRRIARWPSAMPQYNLGHPERLEAIGARLDALPGLRLAGAAYSGIGIPDCIRSGAEAAHEVHRRLQAARDVPLPILKETPK